MKLVVITGSPHKRGTSALLAEEFIKGAKEAGHTVYRFNAALECVHPCIGCDVCGCGANPCVFQDAMNELYPRLKQAVPWRLYPRFTTTRSVPRSKW